MDTVKTHRQDLKKCDKLAETSARDAVTQLITLHLEIIRDEGQVIARLDEMEHFLDVRLNQVRGLRIELREKHKAMRQKMGALPQLLEG